jgi:tetratricopeptide (TPR) repeat protein
MKRTVSTFFLLVIALAATSTSWAGTGKERVQNTDSLERLLKLAHQDSDKFVILDDLFLQTRHNKTVLAYSYAKQMLAVALSGKNKKQQAMAYNAISLICHDIGDYDKSVDNIYKSLHINEELKDSTSMAGSYLNLSNVYRSKNEFKKALDLIKKAENIFSKLGNRRGVAYCCNNIGIIYREQGRYVEGIEYVKKSLFLKIELQDKRGIAAADMNMGILLADLKRYDSAKVYFSNASAIFKKLNDQTGMAQAFMSIGEMLTEMKEYSKAVSLLDSGYRLVVELHDIEDLSKVHKSYYTLYKSLGDNEKAFNHYEAYLILKDSMLSENSSRQVAGMETRYDLEKKEKNIALLEKQSQIMEVQLHKDRIFIVGLIVVTLSIVSLALLLFSRFRFRERLNTELSLANLHIHEQKKEITDSIHYARRIQESILQKEESIRKIVVESFLLYKPKQIVSGDFYWADRTEGEVMLVAVDNALQGVPGAFISLVGINLLNRAVREEGIRDLNNLVTYINTGILSTLKQLGNADDYSGKLNYSICRISGTELECLSTLSPIYVQGPEGVKALARDADSEPGVHRIPLSHITWVYLSSGGYLAQRKANTGEHFGNERMEKLLFSLGNLTPTQQRKKLEEVLENWKESADQNDDILFMGFGI